MTKSRRDLIVGAVSGWLLSLPGCIETGLPQRRDLQFGDIHVEGGGNENYELQIEYEYRAAEGSGSWRSFHDVRLLGYDENRNVVCEEQIGTVGPGDHRFKTEELITECTGFPYLLTFDAEESPCEDTYIEVVAYLGEKDGQPTWGGDEGRQCDEGLPPSIPDDITPGDPPG